jgi:hypothetical protein
VIALSQERATKDRVEASIVAERELEDWSRLKGLLAMLALPPRRGRDNAYRKPAVEVEVEPGEWRAVEDIVLDADGMTFSFGANGHRVEYRFALCPRWRTAWKVAAE